MIFREPWRVAYRAGFLAGLGHRDGVLGLEAAERWRALIEMSGIVLYILYAAAVSMIAWPAGYIAGRMRRP